MSDGSRIQFLHSALDKAETRLRLCTGSCDWRGAREAAEEAAAIDDELKAIRAAGEQGPRNVVSRVTVQG